MKLDDIRPLVAGDARADVTGSYQAFCRESGQEDLGQFLLWLQRKKLLNAEGERRAGVARVAFSNSGNTEATHTMASPQTAKTEATVDRLVSIDPQAWKPGSAQARYTLVGTLGEGGMGQVLLARDNDLRRKVAVKTLRPQYVAEPKVIGRFLSEAQITAQLDHPNVIPIYSLEVDARGGINYTMKMIRGKTLKELIDESTAVATEGRKPDEEHSLAGLLDVFLKVCDAMAYAHSKGVIHRDLKPPNIMIGKYREVYVMDWGIARLMDGREEEEIEERVEVDRPTADGNQVELTRMGQAIGTPRYMSPEQAAGRNRELDGRSDQYALGLILFELVSLRRATPGEDSLTTVKNALAGNKVPLVHVAGKRVPRELRAIVDKATRLRREDRYSSVAAMADDIRRYLRGEEILARRDNPLQRLVRWMGRHREWTLAFIFLLILGSVLQLVWAERRRIETEQRAFARERKVRSLLTSVARQAQRIDARFLEMEEALEGLANVAIWALTYGHDAEEPLYLLEDFRTPGRAPRDVGDYPVYSWPVSLEFPVAVLRPGLKQEEILPKLKRLAPLHRQFRRLFRESSPHGRAPLSPTQERILLGERGVALDWAYIVLAEGVIFLYPGYGSFPPDYDPRGAAYYELSAGKHGKFWGNPYVDSTDNEAGDPMVLPCTMSLWSEAGEFLGVAGVELTFDRIVDQLLSLEGVPAVIEATLVDEEGRKLINTRDKGKRYKTSGDDAGVALELFPIPEVVEAVKAGRTGTMEGRIDGRMRLLALYRLDVKGWTYVVEVDAAEYFKAR